MFRYATSSLQISKLKQPLFYFSPLRCALQNSQERFLYIILRLRFSTSKHVNVDIDFEVTPMPNFLRISSPGFIIVSLTRFQILYKFQNHAPSRTLWLRMVCACHKLLVTNVRYGWLKKSKTVRDACPKRERSCSQRKLSMQTRASSPRDSVVLHFLALMPPANAATQPPLSFLRRLLHR